MLFEAAVADACSVQSALLHHQLVQGWCAVYDVLPNNLGFALEVLYLSFALLYFTLQVLKLQSHFLKIVMLPRQVPHSLLQFAELIIEIGISHLIILLLVFKQHQVPLWVFACWFIALVSIEIRVGFSLHMIQNLLIYLFKARSKFLVLLPYLPLMHLVVVSQLCHVLVPLCIRQGWGWRDIRKHHPTCICEFWHQSRVMLFAVF